MNGVTRASSPTEMEALRAGVAVLWQARFGEPLTDDDWASVRETDQRKPEHMGWSVEMDALRATLSRAQPSDAARRAEEAIAQWHTDRFEILRTASMQQDHMLELQRIRGIQARVHLSSAATIRAREFPQPFQPSDAGSGTVEELHRPLISIPPGGFVSDEAEAHWIADTLALRFGETLSTIGIQAKLEMRGLYDLLLICLNAASKRAVRNALQPVAEPAKEQWRDIAAAAMALRAFEQTEPEKECWDTETGTEEPGAGRFASDWSHHDWNDKRLELRAALDAAIAVALPTGPASEQSQ